MDINIQTIYTNISRYIKIDMVIITKNTYIHVFVW